MKKFAILFAVPAIAVTALVAGAQTASADVYYKNCAEARAAGAAPIMKGEPGYRAGLDRDNDGIACE
ncbi:excalibur calcium-binding domain-containing protein [Nocardia yamanashiensis]|uniref:excalibur calcium-binding domain-containing protein n=1 Tax=Nocardia yamanashiensis TaxID=209247 RepID=UPI001E482CE2|nr:excalibur calcium-binding domain-containing protein [Nocardia yamanashiensis]UGT45053.1 excalibur calcium-binding domain-containing protein [Nocardia yamanashiensis]